MNQTLDNLSLHETPAALAAYRSETGLRADELQLIKEFFPMPPADLLDLGVGSGRTTVALHNMGYRALGIEYCRKLVEYANEHFPSIQILEGDARSLSFDDAVFDAVLFSWNGIDYMSPVSDRLKVLSEVFRVLRPGGCFIVSSRNAMGCVGRLCRPPLLTRRAIRFWMDQLGCLNHVWKGYFRWRDHALGMPLFYSARPSVQKKQLISCGWEVLAIRSAERPSETASAFRDVHVQYVCRKPLL
jgi:ubiquinone/menaquinone biosynthesis C-methylase UbiE